MLVRDIMSSNLVTIGSDTYILDAERTMDSHRITRLPVVDSGTLVGIVTKDDILKASPSTTSPTNQRQLFYLMSKLTVKEIMKQKVHTISPDDTIEKAVTTAQKNKVGSLPVMEAGKLVGIITTTDVFYKVLNPLLGINETGTRLVVSGAGRARETSRMFEAILRRGCTVKTFWVPPDGRFDLILHFDSDDAGDLIGDLRTMGFKVDAKE